MNKKECRSFNFEIRADKNEERGSFIEGRAIVFNQPYDNGWFTEYIAESALENCDLKDVRLLVNHNTDMIPLARSRNNNANSTMQLSVVAEGLDMRANLDTEGNSEAQSLYSAISRGDITGMSFMFTVDGEEWEGLETEKPTRRITAIDKVFEVSAVTWPAYEQTSIEARSSAETLESAKATLESAKEEARKAEKLAKIEELKNRLKVLKEA